MENFIANMNAGQIERTKTMSMFKFIKSVSLVGWLLLPFVLEAQTIDSAILQNRWPAFWVTVPNESPDGYGVYLFRKSVTLSTKPGKFIIHVSADNRYKLFVNEKQVSLGPARGDLSHRNFETLDIGTYLKAGKNIVSAQVWNEGEWKPEAQISFRTGFILQGATVNEAAVNTNETWKCVRDSGYAPLGFNSQTYYVAGAGEIRNMARHPKLWQSENFDDSGWQKAKQIFNGLPKTILGPNALKSDFTFASLPAKLESQFGINATKIIDAYRHTMPKASASDIWVVITSINMMGLGSITVAERKLQQQGAPVYLSILVTSLKQRYLELNILLGRLMRWTLLLNSTTKLPERSKVF